MLRNGEREREVTGVTHCRGAWDDTLKNSGTTNYMVRKTGINKGLKIKNLRSIGLNSGTN